jgi:thiamine biosynthesis protein ThiS
MPEEFSIIVNGESREAKSGETVSSLLLSLGMEGGRVAIERNLQILPRARWPETQLQPGDRFEIVHFVGGG